MKKLNKQGITLIEMVAVIVVLGIAIPPLLTSFGDIAWRSGRAESMADGSFYAQELMEEVKSKDFDENSIRPFTHSSGFSSADPGESKNNASTFDDVDDYAGCTDAAVTSPASGYSRSVGVDYVYLNGSNWTACGSVTCTTSTNCSTCAACCYKRITVTVSRTDNLLPPTSETTIVSAH